MKQCLRVVTVLCLAALFAGVPVVQAEWVENGNIVCGEFHDQYTSVVAADGSGGMIVAWFDERMESNAEIYAQRLDADGNELWAANGVPVCTSSGMLGEMRIVPDGAGGAIVAWQNWNVGPSAVFAQRIDAAGTPLWTAGGDTVSYTGSWIFSYKLIADGAGGALFFWMDERNGDTDLFGQRVGPAGGKLWDPDGIPVCVYTGNQDEMNVIANGDGTFMLTWYDRRASLDPDIYAQKIDTAGTLYWDSDGVPVCTDPAAQFQPVLAPDGMGGAIIAWTDQRYGNFDIFAQRIDYSGSQLWDWNGVPIAASPYDEQWPRIVSDGEGGAIILYNIYPDHEDILIQRVNGYGEIQWWEWGMQVCGGTWYKWSEMLCMDGEGGAIIGFFDGRNNNYWTLYAQRIGHDGSMLWGAFGVPLYEDQGQEIDYAEIAADGAGGALFAWVDNRNGGQYDIFASRLNPYGRLGGFWAPPLISAVEDVPNDQGGKLGLRWDASPADSLPDNHIEYYSAWRLLKDGGGGGGPVMTAAAGLEDLGLSVDFSGEATRRLVTAAGDTWEWLANVPARHAESYGLTVSSLYDSTGSDPGWQHFVVTAHTHDPSIYFDSPVDSGYSVDNLPPLQPVRFEGIQSLVPAGLKLYWEIGEDPDLSHYAVYKGPAEDFVPEAGNLVGTAADTMLLDTGWNPGDENFYKLAAVDVHGNEGPTALLRPENIYVGTLLQSFHAEAGDFRIVIAWTLSEAGDDMTFAALRAAAWGAFAPLAGALIERDGLSFSLKDGSCEPGVTYRYRIEVEDGGGSRVLFETDGITAPRMPLTLFQNAPNPFNPSTSIAFYLPQRSRVRLDIYDVSGRLVRTLLDGTQAAGRHAVSWNGQDGSGRTAASGVYFYRLRAEKFEQTRKMIMLR